MQVFGTQRVAFGRFEWRPCDHAFLSLQFPHAHLFVLCHVQLCAVPFGAQTCVCRMARTKMTARIPRKVMVRLLISLPCAVFVLCSGLSWVQFMSSSVDQSARLLCCDACVQLERKARARALARWVALNLGIPDFDRLRAALLYLRGGGFQDTGTIDFDSPVISARQSLSVSFDFAHKVSRAFEEAMRLSLIGGLHARTAAATAGHVGYGQPARWRDPLLLALLHSSR